MTPSRVAIALACIAATAGAAAADADDCPNPTQLTELGDVKSIAPVGKHGALQVIGTKARGYAWRRAEACFVAPVVGKPLAAARLGARAAYVLGTNCGYASCPGAMSLKDGERVLDVLGLDGCDSASLDRVKLFADHDSLKLSCWSSAGADSGREDLLVDVRGDELAVLAQIDAGVAWVQLPIEGDKRCTARPPGGVRVVATGAEPVIETTIRATPEQAAAAKIEWTAGGCDAIVATTRGKYDAKQKAFVAAGAPKISVVHGLCACTPRK
jgi:hypothetical protein